MSFKKVKKSVKGFALLEVLLAVIIIAAFAAAVVMLYNKVSGNTALSGEEQAVQQVFSAYGQYVSTNYSAPSASDIVSAKLVPDNIVNSSSSADNDAFVGPYGTIGMSGDPDGKGNPQAVDVTATGIPADVAIKFCADMVSSYDVTIAGSSATTASDCSGATLSSTNTLVFSSPKDMTADA